MPISILIVDDHPVICHGLSRILEKQDDMVIVGEADDWKNALQTVEQKRPDIIILDISLQGIDGISLINRILEIHSSTHIIMYTMHSNRDYITRAIQAGAVGYILKGDKTEILVKAIREVIAGNKYLSSDISKQIVEDLAAGKSIADSGGTSSLTAREYEVAALLAQGMNMDTVGETLFISPQTVRVHRTKIMHKLQCSGVHELLLKLREFFPQ